MSDKTKIIKYLKTHKRGLTCMEAIHKLSVYNLRSRICEIANTITTKVWVTRKDGLRVKVARYTMA